MKILLLMQDWFKKEFQEAGHEVIAAALHDQVDHKISTPLMHIDSLIKELPGGFTPDVIIYWDNSAPIFVAGLEETDIPTLFYSVDSHHHAQVHSLVASMFDYTLVAQRDYIPLFERAGNTPEWMPLWASRDVEASDDKKHEVVFVGNLDAKLHPERAKFFAELGQRVPLVCKMGAYWEIFPFSEIVVNQTVKGDLNFRVFETMMCGALLLTERANNGLCELFTDGEHLVLYERNNVSDAVSKIEALLGNRDGMRAIARKGRSDVLQRHTSSHRARRILDILQTLRKTPGRNKFLAAGVQYCSTAFKLHEFDTARCVHAFTHAFKSYSTGMKMGEHFDEDVACMAAVSCIKYDRVVPGGSGAEFLKELLQYEPGNMVFGLARIRYLLNIGKRREAQDLAATVAPEAEPHRIFEQAEEFVSKLLRDVER